MFVLPLTCWVEVIITSYSKIPRECDSTSPLIFRWELLQNMRIYFSKKKPFGSKNIERSGFVLEVGTLLFSILKLLSIGKKKCGITLPTGEWCTNNVVED